MGRRRRSAAAWVAVLLLSACSAPGGGTTPGPAGSAPHTSGSAVGPTVVPPVGPEAQPSSAPAGVPALPAEPVVFLPPGPASPADPPVGATYESISRLACSDAAQLITGTGNDPLWTAVDAACTALVSGSAAQWSQASSLVSGLPPVPAGRCLEAAAVAGARRVLAFHAAHPGTRVQLASPAADACPRRLTGATVLDASGTPTGASRVEVSGPVTGGTVLRLDGFTGAVSGVLANGVPDPDGAIAVTGANSFDPVTLEMPPSNGPGTVRLALIGPLPIAGWIDFTYVAAGPGSPSAAAGASPTPAPSSPATASASALDGSSPGSGP